MDSYTNGMDQHGSSVNDAGTPLQDVCSADTAPPARSFIPARKELAALADLADLEKVTIVSYNILSQMGARRLLRADRGYVDPALLTITRRRELLLQEIMGYDADILCLQEVDDYEDYWAEKLSAGGYDSVYATHPSGTADNGLVIVFRKDTFQLFRTWEIDLNRVATAVSDVNLVARCQQDRLALLVNLQPWEHSRFPSALCVVTTQLASSAPCDPGMDYVRVLQTEFLCREIVTINASFQLPILLTGTFNALPSSDVYHVIRTGRRRPGPEKPVEMGRPIAIEATPSSITIAWTAPPPPPSSSSLAGSKQGSANESVCGYKIAIKNCTSATLGFNMHEIEVDGDQDMTEYTVTMLSAGVPYQFRIAARNQHGYGPFSQPSRPMATPKSVTEASLDRQRSSLSSESKSLSSLGPMSTTIDVKAQNHQESVRTRDNADMSTAQATMSSLYVDDIPPQVKPYSPSIGSGYTPRFDTGANNLAVSPRRLHQDHWPDDAKQYSTLPSLQGMPRGDRDDAIVHCEQFESAYATYHGELSEPEFTMVSEACTATVDYIFFSSGQFAAFELLALPELDELRLLGEDVRQPERIVDTEWVKHKPDDWKDTVHVTRNDDLIYMGEWVAPELPNAETRAVPWLPNRVYPSDHLAIGSVLAIRSENAAVQWN